MAEFKFVEDCCYRLVFVTDWLRIDNRLTFVLILQVEKNINNMTIKMPHQLFINGEFVDAEAGKTYKTINPTDGTVRTKGQRENKHYHKIMCTS